MWSPSFVRLLMLSRNPVFIASICTRAVSSGGLGSGLSVLVDAEVLEPLAAVWW